MTTFIHEPDAADEPTIWVLENGDTDNYRYTALFRRVDLAPDERRWWPDVVARMTGTTITTDDATVERIAATLWHWSGVKAHQADNNIEDFAGSPFRDHYKEAARAILAALTGVPHDR